MIDWRTSRNMLLVLGLMGAMIGVYWWVSVSDPRAFLDRLATIVPIPSDAEESPSPTEINLAVISPQPAPVLPSFPVVTLEPAKSPFVSPVFHDVVADTELRLRPKHRFLPDFTSYFYTR